MTIRCSNDLPNDPHQTDPLRRLINVWRASAGEQAKVAEGLDEPVYNEIVAAAETLYECADALCALLNERDRRDKPVRLNHILTNKKRLKSLPDN